MIRIGSLILTISNSKGLIIQSPSIFKVVKKIDEVVRKISEEHDFRSKINNMGTQLNYEPTALFEKTLLRYQENLQAFFKEEGLVK